MQLLDCKVVVTGGTTTTAAAFQQQGREEGLPPRGRDLMIVTEVQNLDCRVVGQGIRQGGQSLLVEATVPKVEFLQCSSSRFFLAMQAGEEGLPSGGGGDEWHSIGIEIVKVQYPERGVPDQRFPQ